ncbi:LLM class flavin-dependent oxidoreductase [Neobacillus sp. FSL H8-0543]|uniref:LLM class flavin-dependent oxidoreductase n=1 Tax=Neobacillus sp. FSL H8-0543 TaxID=2954672 RepID=UPI00315988F8
MELKTGVFFMPEHQPDANPTEALMRDVDQIVLAEELGYDEAWVGEHHSGGREIVPSAEIMLAYVAAVTNKIKLGTGVVSLPYHHPFQVAERAAFLDHLTKGRLILGIGAGGLPGDMELFDIKPEDTRPMMGESLEMILKVFNSNGPVSHKGKYWEMNDVELNVKPYQTPHPPMAIAGLATLNSFTIAAEKGLIPLSVMFSPVHILKQHGEVLDRVAKENGRPSPRPDWRITRVVYVAETTEQAWADIRKGAEETYYDYLFGIGLRPLAKVDPDMPDEDVTLEYMAETGPWIIGDPDECVRKINKLREEIGDFGTLLITQYDWTTPEKWKKSLELFAKYVKPRIQKDSAINVTVQTSK